MKGGGHNQGQKRNAPSGRGELVTCGASLGKILLTDNNLHRMRKAVIGPDGESLKRNL